MLGLKRCGVVPNKPTWNNGKAIEDADELAKGSVSSAIEYNRASSRGRESLTTIPANQYLCGEGRFALTVIGQGGIFL